MAAKNKVLSAHCLVPSGCVILIAIVAEKFVHVATFSSLEAAEEAGAVLIENGIQARIEGTGLLVALADEENARGILDLRQQVLEQRDPFHPCPRCGEENPDWYGKRKVILLGALMIGLILLARSEWSGYFIPALFVGFALFAVTAWNMPEFECRRCGHRWNNEHKKEPD